MSDDEKDQSSVFATSQIKRLLQAGAASMTNDKILMPQETVKLAGQTAQLFHQYFLTLALNNLSGSKSKAKKNLSPEHIYSVLDDIHINSIRRNVVARAVELNRTKWVRKAQQEPDLILNKPAKKANTGKKTKDGDKLVSLTGNDDDEEEEEEEEESEEEESEEESE